MRDNPVEITLIRHGQSTFNAKGLYQGASDVPRLTTKGKAQAAKAANLLSGQYDHLWVSPLSRAQETAEIMASAYDLPTPQIEPHLSEIDLPEWEGCAFADIKEQERVRHRVWKFTPSCFSMTAHDGTIHYPANNVECRAKRFFNKAQVLAPGSRLLAVSHSGFIRAALVAALGLPKDQLHALRIDNCALTQILLWRDGTIELTAFNQTSDQMALPSLSEQQAAIIVTDAEDYLALKKHIPQAQFCALSALPATQDADILDADKGIFIAHGSQGEVSRFLENMLGLDVNCAVPLSLRKGHIHIVLPKGPSDPARLWQFNRPYPGNNDPDLSQDKDQVHMSAVFPETSNLCVQHNNTLSKEEALQ